MNNRLLRVSVGLVLSGLLALSGCSGHSGSPKSRAIGVTTSWLECAVRDIAGERFETVRLLPPGDCPGHFDLSPGTISKLSGCQLLFRFDFQEGLDAKLSGVASRGLRTVAVAIRGGLCVPGSYLEACRQMERAFQEKFPDSAGEFRSRVAAIEKRLSDLSSVVRGRIGDAGLRGRKVVCSEHQASFCGWLGLDVVAQFCRAENMTSSAVKEVIAAAERCGARLVIANEQEGRRVADSLAQRLGAAVIVFSNFPSMEGNQQRFDDLVLCNVESLIRGAKP